MQNEWIFIISVVLYLGSVLVLYKLFGKNGLFAFAIFGTLLGNIAVCKTVDMFGVSTTAGNVLYAATFLVTDILSEKYGKKDASRAVAYCFTIMVLWLIGTQLILQFTPNASDYVHESLLVVFGLVPRITVASLAGFICSQNLDVFLYHYIWSKTGNTSQGLWLRNNGSTLTSQAIDTVIFTTIAFWGVYPVNVFLSIMITTYAFKAAVALLDTPFMYLARKIKPMNERPENYERERTPYKTGERQNRIQNEI
ncbi:MAG: queuosine precursor transporter [Eubacterium sp.]|nr:queuosine precursor transporter [Eubacterium sp.]